MKPHYNTHPFTVTDIKGTQVTAQRGSTVRIRNMGKVKLLRERPARLKHRQNVKMSDAEESDEEDWLYLLDTARINTEREAPQTNEKQQGGQADEDMEKGHAVIRVQAEVQEEETQK